MNRGPWRPLTAGLWILVAASVSDVNWFPVAVLAGFCTVAGLFMSLRRFPEASSVAAWSVTVIAYGWMFTEGGNLPGELALLAMAAAMSTYALTLPAPDAPRQSLLGSAARAGILVGSVLLLAWLPQAWAMSRPVAIQETTHSVGVFVRVIACTVLGVLIIRVAWWARESRFRRTGRGRDGPDGSIRSKDARSPRQ